MRIEDRKFTVIAKGSAVAMVPVAKQRLVVIAPAGGLMIYAKAAEGTWGAKA